MSKRLSWLLPFLLALTLLAACGGATSTPSAAPAKESVSGEAEAVEGEAEAAQANEAASVDEATETAPAEPTAQAEGDSLEEEVQVIEPEEEAPADDTAAETESKAAPTAAVAEAPAEEDVTEEVGPAEAAVKTALTAREAYDLALAEALAWQPDAVLIEMGASALGALDAEGKSESWSFAFWSPEAKELNSMIFINGALTATPVPNTGAPKPIPAMDSVILDTERLFQIAAEAGGSKYIAEGYSLMPGLTTYPLDDAVPTWYMNYFDPGDNTLAYNVIIDARSGEVIQTTTP